MTDSNMLSLHQMNPLQRFSERATDYAKYRPSYPGAAISHILAELANPSTLVAADVGAGTGIASRLLAAEGIQVWAVEPNSDMRDAAEPHPHVTFQAGTAEQTGLPDAAVDLVTCFQAFHWFDPIPTLEEFRRILLTPGRLALVWNDRNLDDGFTAAYSQLIRATSGNHPAERRFSQELTLSVLQGNPLFGAVRQQTVPYCQSLDLQGLMGRAASTSYLPRHGTACDQLLADLTQLHGEWADADGLVHLVYSTNLFLADAL